MYICTNLDYADKTLNSTPDTNPAPYAKECGFSSYMTMEFVCDGPDDIAKLPKTEADGIAVGSMALEPGGAWLLTPSRNWVKMGG